jgi:hypothetical protein
LASFKQLWKLRSILDELLAIATVGADKIKLEPTVSSFHSSAIPTARESLDKNSLSRTPFPSDPAPLSILSGHFESQLVRVADPSASA